MNDEHYMQLALRLAAKGRTSPNPRVGAVVVRGEEILATGYHRAAGRAHAEIEVLEKLSFRAPGTRLYVNLEPCSHFGRTPPCTEAIIRAGVREVVAGMVDPNPLVRGKGFEALRQAGVTVRAGVLEEACQELNRGFVKSITAGLPYVTLKLAASADGKTATRSGASKWITSTQARRHVHRMRRKSDAVLVGVGTVLHDDPQLTARDRDRLCREQPTRVLIDSLLRAPLEARVFNQDAPTLLFTTQRAPSEKVEALKERGVMIEVLDSPGSRPELGQVMRSLNQRGLTYVMAEPGAELAAALARGGWVDRYCFFFAPKLFAGTSAPGLLGGPGIEAVAEATCLRWARVRRFGPDLMLEAFPVSDETPAEDQL